jgi:hypothetical protein
VVLYAVIAAGGLIVLLWRYRWVER